MNSGSCSKMTPSCKWPIKSFKKSSKWTCMYYIRVEQILTLSTYFVCQVYIVFMGHILIPHCIEHYISVAVEAVNEPLYADDCRNKFFSFIHRNSSTSNSRIAHGRFKSKLLTTSGCKTPMIPIGFPLAMTCAQRPGKKVSSENEKTNCKPQARQPHLGHRYPHRPRLNKTFCPSAVNQHGR